MHPLVPRLFCFGFDGTTAPAAIRGWLAAGLAGAILFRRNLIDPDQIRRLTAELAAAAPGPILVGVDQEGGRVTRLPPPFLTLPSAGELGRLDDPDLTRRLSRAVGVELRAAGITWNLAPVLDVHTHPANPIIGDRAYGASPELVARHGLAVLRGLAEGGVLAAGKHFPGHGDTAVDSHLALPVSGQAAERWRRVEFLPFRAAIREGVPMLLMGHLLCPHLDPLRPASLSPAVIGGILREELGFAGVVVSDDLEMGAVRALLDDGEAAVQFLEAGGDLILICRLPAYQQAALRAVEGALASGRLTVRRLEASVERIAGALRRLPSADPLPGSEPQVIGGPDHRRLQAELQARLRPSGDHPAGIIQT